MYVYIIYICFDVYLHICSSTLAPIKSSTTICTIGRNLEKPTFLSDAHHETMSRNK